METCFVQRNNLKLRDSPTSYRLVLWGRRILESVLSAHQRERLDRLQQFIKALRHQLLILALLVLFFYPDERSHNTG